MGTYGTKGAVLGACDEGLVVAIDGGCGNVSCAYTPVVGVIRPNDGAETKGMSDCTDAVVDVAKRRLLGSEVGTQG